MTKALEDYVREAEAALSSGDAQEAFQLFRGALEYPGLLDGVGAFEEGLELFSRIGGAIAGDELQAVIYAAFTESNDPERLFSLGYQLIEHGLDGIAATVLTRAHALAPQDEKFLHELVCALEGIQRSADICELLRAQAPIFRSSFVTRYFLAFHSLMCGDIDAARQLLPDLLRDALGEAHEAMSGRVERILARIDLVQASKPLDDRDLRGWQYALCGSFLTHLSPYGYEDPMRGRYAWFQDTLAMCRLGIERLALLLETWGTQLETVVAPAERGAQILAHAVAGRLGIEVGDWESPPSEKTLVVAYDLSHLEGADLVSLRNLRPGSFVWAHATCWTRTFPLAADVTTLLYQSITPPWGEALTVDSESSEVVAGAADTRSPTEVAADLLATEPDDHLVDGDLEGLLQLAEVARPEAAAERVWAGSPVPSNRFL